MVDHASLLLYGCVLYVAGHLTRLILDERGEFVNNGVVVGGPAPHVAGNPLAELGQVLFDLAALALGLGVEVAVPLVGEPGLDL